MSSYSGAPGDAGSSIRVLLLALRCQLEANEEPEDTTTEITGVQGLSGLPTTTLLERLLKVFRSCASASAVCATDAAMAFQHQQGWQTLLALLSSTSPTTTPASPVDSYLAAEVAEVLDWVVQYGQGWPAFVPWRLVQLALGTGSTAGARQASWRVLAAAAGNRDLLHTLHTTAARVTSPSPAAAAGYQSKGTTTQSTKQEPVAGAAAPGSSEEMAGPTTSTTSSTSRGGTGHSTWLSQLLQALDQEAYRQHLTPEAAQHVALLVLRCAASKVETSWSWHPAQLLLQLHASLVSPQDLPQGCHCPSAAAAAGGGGGDGEQHGGGGYNRPHSAGGWPNMSAAGCAACDAALQLLSAARQLVFLSTEAATQPSGTTPAAHATFRTNHSSTGRVQGQACGGLDLLTKGVVSLVKELSRAAPRRLAAKLSWEGTTTSYEQRPAAADPCTPINTCSGPWQALLQVCSQIGSLNGGQQQFRELEVPGTHLEAALQLLLTCCQALVPAQKKSLYMSTDIGGLLEALGDYITPGVPVLTQQLYGCLCQGFAGLREEVLTAGAIPGLCGMVCYSSAPGVKLAALEKLPQVLDSCGGQQFLLLCQPGGVVSWVTQLLAGRQSAGTGLAAGDQVSSSGGHSPCTGADSQPHGGGDSAAGSSSSSSTVCGDRGSGTARDAPLQTPPLQHQPDGLLMAQLLRAAAQVYCSLLGRARRMRPDGAASVATLHLPAHQLAGAGANEAGGAGASSAGGVMAVMVPRWGGWRQLAPTETLALEQVALRLLCAPLSPLSAGDEDQGAQPAAGGDGAHSNTAAAAGAEAAARSNTVQQQQGLAQGRVSHSKRVVKEARCLSSGRAGAPACSTLDEDGLRVVWDSGPSPAVCAVRSTWSALPLRERISWSQTLQDVEIRLILPPGTTKRDLAVNVQRERLTIKLTWCGRVVDGPLYRPVAYSSSCWSLDTVPMPKANGHLVASSGSSCSKAAGSRPEEHPHQQKVPGSGGKGQASGGASKEVEWSELLLVMPKEEGGHYWKGLFEGGEEKSYWEILTEAVQCEEDAAQGPSLDQMGPEAAVLWEDLQERAAMVASGELDLEHGFDDFRIVIGDNTL